MIKLGLIGFGRIGTQQLDAASELPDIRFVAIADPHIARPSHQASSLQWYKQWRQMLDEADLDAVSICVPHHLHHSIAQAALAAGKHVLIEKPMALNAAEARDLIVQSKSCRRIMMVELTHRFYPPLTQAAAIVRSGRLGEVWAVEDRIIEPAGTHISGWLAQRAKAGGGVALTNGIHMLDRIAFVTGQPLRFLRGVAGHSGGLGDIEDTAAMLLSLDNGAPVQLLAAWPPGNGPADDELTIYGTRGTLRVWAWRGWRFEPVGGGPAEQHESYDIDNPDARVRVALQLALQEFISAVRDDRAPDPPADVALAAQELIDEFYRHIQTAGSAP